MSSTALHDVNRVPTLLGTSLSDGTTPVTVLCNLSHGVSIADGSSGSDAGGAKSRMDVNRVPSWIAVSNVNGTTPVAIYANATTGALLVQGS